MEGSQGTLGCYFGPRPSRGEPHPGRPRPAGLPPSWAPTSSRASSLSSAQEGAPCHFQSWHCHWQYSPRATKAPVSGGVGPDLARDSAGGLYGMLALLRRRPSPDWGHLQAPGLPGPSSCLPFCHSDHDATARGRGAYAATLGCRFSRGCQVQPEHAATKHAVTPQCTGSESRPHMSPSTRRANSSSKPLKVAKEHTALSGLRLL